MQTFKYKVSLVVEAEGFTQFDAEEAIRDALGIGDMCGVNILECELTK